MSRDPVAAGRGIRSRNRTLTPRDHMAYEATKRIKGRDYRYLVEAYICLGNIYTQDVMAFAMSTIPAILVFAIIFALLLQKHTRINSKERRK